MNSEKAYAKAYALFQARNLHEAETICKRIVAKNRRHADALNMLGVIAFHARDYYAAAQYLEKALEVKPNHADACSNLANALQEQGDFERAMAFARKAISLDASNVEAQNIVGMILHKRGDLDGAIQCYQKALEIKPSFSHAHHNLGVALEGKGLYIDAITAFQKAAQYNPKDSDTCFRLGLLYKKIGQPTEAIPWFHKAIQLKPDHIDAMNNLGTALIDAGKTREAIAAFRQALQLDTAHADACYNLATALHKLNQIGEAEKYYRKAIQLDGSNALAYNNLGTLLHEQGKNAEAKLLFQQALIMSPGYADVHYNLGTILQEENDLDGAVACYRAAINLKPDLLVAYNNLGNTLAAQGKLQEAIDVFMKALQTNPSFVLILNNIGNVLKDQGKLQEAEAACKKAIATEPDFYPAHSNLLFFLNYNANHTGEDIFSEHVSSGLLFDKLSSSISVSHANDPSPDRKLRIGYVSPDFREHSVAYFIEPVVRGHSKALYEVICYSHSPVHDAVTDRLMKDADRWINITRVRDDIASKLIRDDAIDILVDLTGHTADNRLTLFARKPAPIQVSWIGYPATTGLRAMDYKIVDSYTDPPGVTDHLYTERLIRLPDTFLCYLPDPDSPEVGPPPFRSAGHITFGSFNNFPKVSPPVFRMWQTILQRLPTSRLVMKARSLADPTVCNRVITAFKNAGISEDRVELISWKRSRREHLELYGRIDIALDTFPYHGTTTTCEALWMGVPVITLAGTTHASRVGVTLLTNVGLLELIAKTEEEYMEKVVALAGDTERLLFLRQNLRSMLLNSPLTDAQRFTENLEKCYRDIWRKWCNQQ